jgi:hypothetical protein
MGVHISPLDELIEHTKPFPKDQSWVGDPFTIELSDLKIYSDLYDDSPLHQEPHFVIPGNMFLAVSPRFLPSQVKRLRGLAVACNLIVCHVKTDEASFRKQVCAPVTLRAHLHIARSRVVSRGGMVEGHVSVFVADDHETDPVATWIQTLVLAPKPE